VPARRARGHARPGLSAEVVTKERAVPRREIEPPGLSVLPRRSTREGNVGLDAVDILTDLAHHDVRSPRGAIVLKEVVPVDRGKEAAIGCGGDVVDPERAQAVVSILFRRRTSVVAARVRAVAVAVVANRAVTDHGARRNLVVGVPPLREFGDLPSVEAREVATRAERAQLVGAHRESQLAARRKWRARVVREEGERRRRGGVGSDVGSCVGCDCEGRVCRGRVGRGGVERGQAAGAIRERPVDLCHDVARTAIARTVRRPRTIAASQRSQEQGHRDSRAGGVPSCSRGSSGVPRGMQHHEP